jgi:hypothetical protein
MLLALNFHFLDDSNAQYMTARSIMLRNRSEGLRGTFLTLRNRFEGLQGTFLTLRNRFEGLRGAFLT